MAVLIQASGRKRNRTKTQFRSNHNHICLIHNESSLIIAAGRTRSPPARASLADFALLMHIKCCQYSTPFQCKYACSESCFHQMFIRVESPQSAWHFGCSKRPSCWHGCAAAMATRHAALCFSSPCIGVQHRMMPSNVVALNVPSLMSWRAAYLPCSV
ncbi:hypothetical protein EJ03DRAFT_195797 [Teratosphaeria nubilosa]|uniref:Uncharacterized protein n=1 Tax=Teratosphaeria nubilosa TaxID=161662 RepID=A0A6G1KZ16_9PEZI|nr:hypothetical protein EJ03DRAFT_195797 [Teratosphaeria nubilosa]